MKLSDYELPDHIKFYLLFLSKDRYPYTYPSIKKFGDSSVLDNLENEEQFAYFSYCYVNRFSVYKNDMCVSHLIKDCFLSAAVLKKSGSCRFYWSPFDIIPDLVDGIDAEFLLCEKHKGFLSEAGFLDLTNPS